jgi:transposase-like protein
MNRAERFYTVAPNGRRARVQRYRCAVCRRDHIRTHISDAAIHALENLPARRAALQN